MPDRSTITRRAVLLLHEGHGAPHTDLLLERDDGPLVTFRAPVGLVLLLTSGDVAAFEAERLPEHRRVYLDYEGPVSNGRGVVQRVATLELRGFTETPDSIAFEVAEYPAGHTGNVASSVSGTRWTARFDARGLWRFEGRGRLEEPAAIAGVPR